MHVDLVRQLQKSLYDVEIEPVLPHYSELIRRLRLAGIKISDRRAVKLQRTIAASALLCGRMHALTSDFWVLRHIWDTDEQQEVIVALVDSAMSAAGGADQPGSHPRARQSDAPDPETLAAEINRIATRLDSPDLPASERAQLRDEVGLLASRCEWVTNAHQREYLQKEIQTLWPRVNSPT